jgi:enamine deaminase RidA (YjgF/YER057c/UK114 family)
MSSVSNTPAPLVESARRGGPFLFFGGHVGLDERSGRPVARFRDADPADADRLRTGNLMIDAPAERAVAQACRIVRDVEAHLRANGGTLTDLVQQRWFVRNERDLAPVARALGVLLQDSLPATTLVAADGPGLAPEIAVHADFIALARPTPWSVQNLRIDELDALTFPFPAATRTGPFLFTTPVAGVDLATGRVVTTFRELDASARALAEPPYAGRGEAAAAQQVQVFKHVERILAAQGASLACQVRQNGWMRMPMSEFGPASAVRRRLFSGGNTGPFTSLTVSGLRSADALFEYGVMALVPGESQWTRSVRNPPHGIASYYVAAVQAGPLVASAGEVPVDADAGTAITAHPLAARGRIDASGVALAQAFDVYGKLERALADYGAKMADVVHQTLYVVDGADVAAVERVAALTFGHTLPPTTVVPILATSPFRESRLEVEVIAAIG